MVLGVKKVKSGVVGILDDGTVLTCSEDVEQKLKAKGVKVLRVGRISML
jgi:hypothetical protein